MSRSIKIIGEVETKHGTVVVEHHTEYACANFYIVKVNGVMKHQCSADNAIRVLCHYLQGMQS